MFDWIDRKHELKGLRFSAILLFSVGLVLVSGWLLLAALLFVATKQAMKTQSIQGDLLFLIFYAAALGVLSLAALGAARALTEEKRWAAFVATCFGLLFLLLSADIVSDIYYSKRQPNDFGYAVLLLPFLAGSGLWWCVYLNLPHVRAILKGKSQIRR